MYTKEVRKLVLSKAKRLQNEAKKGSLLLKIDKPLERSSLYIGISLTTIKKWTKDPNGKEKETKEKLYSLIKEHKPKKKYVVDRMLENHGHFILRLPAYHYDLNPIENFRCMLKNDVSRNNTTFKLNDMKLLVDQAIDRITLRKIKLTIGHVRKTEKILGLRCTFHFSGC